MPHHGKATDQLTAREWQIVRAQAGRRSHPATRQRHENAQGDADLRQREWQSLRPNDHLHRKAVVGRA